MQLKAFQKTKKGESINLMNLSIISYYVFFSNHSQIISIFPLPIQLLSIKKLYTVLFNEISLISLSVKPLDALPKQKYLESI